MSTRQFEDVIAVGLPELAKFLRNTHTYTRGRPIKIAGRRVRLSFVKVLGGFFYRVPRAIVHLRGTEELGA